MKNSFSTKFYTRPCTSSKGYVKIYVRIILNRRKAEWNTSCTLPAQDWNDKNESSTNISINNYLAGLKEKITNCYLEYIRTNQPVTVQQIKLAVTGKSNKLRLVEYFENHIEKKESRPDEFKKATITIYKNTLCHLLAFLNSQRLVEIPLSQFNRKLALDFEHFLRTSRSLSVNTTAKHIKKLRTVLHSAVDEGLLTSNPMAGIRVKLEKTNRTYLTLGEIKLLEELKDLPKIFDEVLDVFLFSVYTGLRYSDVQKLSQDNVSQDSSGTIWLTFTSHKTNDRIRIPLLHQAVTIMQKYQGSQPNGLLLPTRSNTKQNQFLKVLGAKANINKTITCHVARHTFATSIRAHYKVPIEVMGRLLGHKKIQTTMIYAKITDEEAASYIQQINQL